MLPFRTTIPNPSPVAGKAALADYRGMALKIEAGIIGAFLVWGYLSQIAQVVRWLW